MKQQEVTVSSVTQSPWLWVDSRRATDQMISFNTSIELGSTLVYDVEYTIDENTKERWNNISIAATTGPDLATVTQVSHGLKTGDSVIVFDSGYVNHSPDAPLHGTFNVTVTDADTYTYNPLSTVAAQTIKARAISFNTLDHPDVAAESTAQTGTFDATGVINGVRLNVTAYTDGNVTLKVLQNG